MMNVAVLGASGFIGSRIVEIFHLGERARVRRIARSYAGLARLGRFDLDGRVADACDVSTLTAAFEGCEIVIHAVVGDSPVIIGSARAAYLAAQRAGVRRIIYLSTASVHGQAPVPGTDEDSPLSENHHFAYNNAKVRAERDLQRMRSTGSVELVILRPAIVFGPRSRWMTEIAGDMLRGTACLLNGGSGICNSIYVDNLVHTVELSMNPPEADGQAFLVGDAGQITWREFYQPLADAFGVENIPSSPPPIFRRTWKDRARGLHVSRPVQGLLPLIPPRLKRATRAALGAWNEPATPSPWTTPEPPRATVTEEMALLQQCEWQLPWSKAERSLGYRPIVSFAEGMHRSIGWLKFADYSLNERTGEP